MGKNQNYEEFVEKFQHKMTTDDCYTPPMVYEIIKNHALEMFPDWIGKTIVRPFYPEGDFEHFDYPENCVVIDNPPFSIYTKIVRWYCKMGIPFFLFAPHLTASQPDADVTFIICDGKIRYHNGAVVNTAFVTNHPSDFRIIVDPELHDKLCDTARESVKNVKKRNFSPHVTSTSRLGKFAAHGISLKIRKSDCKRIKKSGGVEIFGSGFLLSTAARDMLQKALPQVIREEEECIQLSEEEKQTIAHLDGLMNISA